MTNPLRQRQTLGWPSHDFYRSWLHDKRAKPDDLVARRALWLKIREKESSDITTHLFSTVRDCTPEQLAGLAGRLQKERFSFILDAMQEAIIGFGESGSLAKVQALFSSPQWSDFKTSLALHESFSSQHMPLYADDVIAWCNQAAHPDDLAEDQLLMRIALNACPCDTPKVVSVMQRLGPIDFTDWSTIVQATDNIVSLVYDTPPELRAIKATELGEQLIRLHDGWGIRYPAALLTRILQKEHGKEFFLPPLATMAYEGYEDDANLAVLFGAKGLDVPTPKPDVQTMGILVQSLYDESTALAFCIEGASDHSMEQPDFEPTVDLFQDVGQP